MAEAAEKWIKIDAQVRGFGSRPTHKIIHDYYFRTMDLLFTEIDHLIN
jgi:hypothetical protein